jgi:demethylmenaquinone methyltransferase / 2-methoxy-6-polyprenyl-1,4-benzoquinol methylase
LTHQYYQQGTERANRVRLLFDRIARRYDLINDLQSFGLHRHWKRRLLKLAALRKGIRALDVCCGTGDIAEALHSQDAQVIGCDFSASMLRVAATRSQSIPYIQADALHLPFPTCRFDVVTISYGLRNLASFQAGLSELLRVLKPGGSLLILDFGKPSNPLWRALYFAYLRVVVPVFGLIFCGDSAAYSYILDSLHNYPAQQGVKSLLEELGCEQVEVYNFLGGIMSIHRAVRPASLRQGNDIPLAASHLVS